MLRTCGAAFHAEPTAGVLTYDLLELAEVRDFCPTNGFSLVRVLKKPSVIIAGTRLRGGGNLISSCKVL
jgi:hypothetical protein